MSTNEKPENLGPRLAILVFVLAFGLRAGYLLTAEQTPLHYWCDANAYRTAGLAASTLNFPPDVLGRMGLQGPIYPLFLGMIFWIQGGDSLDSVRWIQAILDSCTCLLAALVAARLAGKLPAILTGLLVACHPGLILHIGAIHTETLGTCLLWLAVLGLVMLPDTRAILRTVSIGCLLGLACLTRVTLLPVVPFIILAACTTTTAGKVSRTMRTLWFGLGCAAVLMGWSMYASRVLQIGPSTVSGSGIDQQLGVIRAAADPARHGWAVWSGLPGDPSPIESTWLAGPLRTAAVLTQISFCQLWYSDNIWRESYVLDPWGMDVVQRFLTVCAVFGLFFVPLRDKKWMGRHLVLIALVLGLLGAAVKYIEIRPMLPYQPALAVLAGIFLAAVAPAWRRLLPWVSGAGLVAFLLTTRFSVLTRLFPSIDPQALGVGGDVAVLFVLAGFGVLVSILLAKEMPAARAWLAGCGAMLFLSLGYGCAASSLAAPRWRSWQLDLAQQAPAGVRQHIRLPEAIDPAEVEEVTCVADITSRDGAPKIDLNVNGTLCENAEWRPSRPWNQAMQDVFFGLAHFSGREWPTWPQWWESPLPTSVLANGREVTLEMRTRQSGVALGGTYGPSCDSRYCGPGLVRRGWVSCYRWEVLEDWRVWEESELASSETNGHLLEAGSAGTEYLAGALARQQAGLGIRLVIRYKDGRRLVY